MISLQSLLGDNKLLQFAVVFVALLVVALLVYGLYRLAVRSRLKTTGARGRQPRLGVVDAFDLDRQRQLVIVRRDNVEHLVMIGGPNDVVIETSIIRAEARREAAREAREPTLPGLEEEAPRPARAPQAPARPAAEPDPAVEA
ncbi:MAG: flagellar biosynthetic protein FliO, partial [Methylobacteriaceae bacterium]|nr:flagellar biosynthetic protein FliO [Methylobacteriaceae bacterium]